LPIGCSRRLTHAENQGVEGRERRSRVPPNRGNAAKESPVSERRTPHRVGFFLTVLTKSGIISVL
jgi:hypothetical protein